MVARLKQSVPLLARHDLIDCHLLRLGQPLLPTSIAGRRHHIPQRVVAPNVCGALAESRCVLGGCLLLHGFSARSGAVPPIPPTHLAP